MFSAGAISSTDDHNGSASEDAMTDTRWKWTGRQSIERRPGQDETTRMGQQQRCCV